MRKETDQAAVTPAGQTGRERWTVEDYVAAWRDGQDKLDAAILEIGRLAEALQRRTLQSQPDYLTRAEQAEARLVVAHVDVKRYKAALEGHDCSGDPECSVCVFLAALGEK